MASYVQKDLYACGLEEHPSVHHTRTHGTVINKHQTIGIGSL